MIVQVVLIVLWISILSRAQFADEVAEEDGLDSGGYGDARSDDARTEKVAAKKRAARNRRGWWRIRVVALVRRAGHGRANDRGCC